MPEAVSAAAATAVSAVSSGGMAPIQKMLPETPLRDVMEGASRWNVPIHQHGFIALVDAMPRLVPEGQTADSAIVQSARVSYGQGTKMRGV